MARRTRNFEPGVAAHLVNRGNNRQAIFRTERDYVLFRHLLGEELAEVDVALHSYVLMPNHFHLLVTPGGPNEISTLMQAVARRYSTFFNRCHARTGTLWEGRYRYGIVKTDRYLFACHRYIDLNPVRARLTSRAGDYIWSSHHAYAAGKPDPLLKPHPLVAGMGRDPRNLAIAYLNLFTGGVDDEELNEIRDATARGRVLGDLP